MNVGIIKCSHLVFHKSNLESYECAVYPGRTLMFSFCWTKSVVTTASNAVMLLHIAYLLTWLAISISRFTRSFSYLLLRCYAVTNCLPETCCQFVQFVSHGHFRISCYAVTLLRCYDVTMFVEVVSHSHFRICCYDVTLLHIAYLF